MASRHQAHQTQWAAQFAVASELCKRGYEVAFTLGHNTPLADLMVISPNEQHFLIDVKGLSAKSSWIVKRKEARLGLYYVLAFVPREGSNEFFVLTQEQATKLVEQNSKRRSKESARAPWDGFLFGASAAFSGKWDSLPR
jgi:hypothetical protein